MRAQRDPFVLSAHHHVYVEGTVALTRAPYFATNTQSSSGRTRLCTRYSPRARSSPQHRAPLPDIATLTSVCLRQACPGRGVGPTEPEVSRAAVYVTMSPIERATPEGKGCHFLVFVQLFEKYGNLIERNTALIEKVSALIVLEERRVCVELNTGNGHTAHHPMAVRGRSWPPEDMAPPETPYSLERLSKAQRLLVDGGGGE
eukprot:SAG31_NODE_8338_length_1471_cov_17.047134_2_plen_202_part_00